MSFADVPHHPPSAEFPCWKNKWKIKHWNEMELK